VRCLPGLDKLHPCPILFRRQLVIEFTLSALREVVTLVSLGTFMTSADAWLPILVWILNPSRLFSDVGCRSGLR
jgi:hypothetical protein